MSYYHPRKAFGPEDVIYKARQYENALQDRLKFVHKYENMMRYAQFEQSNGPRCSYRSLAEKLEGIKHEREQALLHRRHKLSTLLTAEDATLQNEIVTGTMNLSERRAWLLSQALALSSQSACPDTNLEKTLREDYNELSLHRSKLAIERAEAERKRLRDNETIHRSLQDHGLNEDVGETYEQAVDILRQNLFMVGQLREEEKAAVEEDMISMHREWLKEEEGLRRQQREGRHQQSLQANKVLLSKAEDLTSCERELGDKMFAMGAHKEAEEEKQLKELRAAHRRDALAYVCQLKVVAEKQRAEDEELEAMIKTKMLHPTGNDTGQRPFSPASEEMAGDQKKAEIDSIANWVDTEGELSKKDLVDILEGQKRGFQAAQLVDLEVNRLPLQGSTNHSKASESKVKPTDMDLPYPEPYYGRKAVKWYE